MATDENSVKSPRVKIRWCRTVRCISKEVYLVLTTANESPVSLLWKDELGWYESDLVCLPSGLHSGYLLIREKVQSYIFQPKLQEISTIKEREYKIDPFFVTNQRFCVELFIDSSRTQNGRSTDSLNVQQRFFSSQLLVSPSEEEKSVEKSKKWSSSYELRNSPCDDANESLKLVNDFNIKEKLSLDNQNGKYFKASTEEIPYKLESPYSASNLRKCVSLDDKQKAPIKNSKSGSSYHSKSRSLYFEDDSGERSNFNFPISNFLISESIGQKNIPGSEVLHRCSSSSQKTWSVAGSSVLNSDIIANVKNILGQLKANQKEEERSKYYFKEFDPQEESNGGYGCLITFESCSSSMDDLGSPRALEDVLVSLTSSETEANKYSGHFRDIKVVSKEPTNVGSRLQTALKRNQATNFVLGRTSHRQSSEADVEITSNCDLSGTDKSDSKYPESDITINEDENFQYDSLKHDDQTIPLNIRDVLASEDSLDYDVNDFKESGTDQKEERLSVTCKAIVNKSSSDESSTFRETKSNGSRYKESELPNLKETRKYPNSANGVIATSPLILVHPGSLRSETDNAGSGTYVVNTESDSTPSEIELFKTVNTVRKLSESLNTFVKPTEPTTIEVQKLIPNKKTKIVIVRDKRPLTMNSGTQTTYRDSYPKVIEKSTRLRTRAQRDQKYSSSSTLSKVNSYTPLPNKVQGPWLSKRTNFSAEERFRQTFLEKFKQNFRNLAKVENILKNINPACDYLDNDNKSFYEEKSFSPQKFTVTQSAYNSFKENSSRNRGPTFSSRNSVPIYSRPSVSFQSTLQNSFNDSSDSSGRPQNSYFSPTKLKKVSTPIFSIYGKDATRGYAAQSTNYRHNKRPILQSSLTNSVIRSANSLPDVRGSFEEDGSPTLVVSQKFRRRPQVNISSYPKFTSESPYRSRRIFRGRSSEPNIFYQKDLNSAGSTESLIEEAFRFSNSLNSKRDNEFKESVYKSLPVRRRGRTRSTSLVSHRSESPSSNWPSPVNSPRLEDSISSALRARSDTDLRMVGLLAGGYKGQQPYLPYSKKELSVGQVVKVLVPGEGVAMARIIYTPPDNKFLRSRYNDNISVLLISEPTNLSGSVINVPMNKILLAWPKTLL